MKDTDQPAINLTKTFANSERPDQIQAGLSFYCANMSQKTQGAVVQN